MRFGPFPIHLINRLREALDQHGGTYEIWADGEARDQYHARDKGRLTRYVAFDPKDLFLIEIPREHLLMVKGELEAMGVLFTSTDFDAGLDQHEYLCPKCEAPGPAGAKCPRHRVPLIEFGELVEWRAKRNSRRRRAMFWLFVALAAAGAARIWFA